MVPAQTMTEICTKSATFLAKYSTNDTERSSQCYRWL